MRLPRFEYLKPSSLHECLELLEGSGHETRVMSGGTDFLVRLKQGVISPQKVLSIRSVEELNFVSEDDKGDLQIGACTNLSDLLRHPLVLTKFPSLHHAINSVGSKHIRNMATIGGNLCLAPRCWYYNQTKQWRHAIEVCYRTGGKVCHAISGSKRCHAINSSDTVPMLIALDARVCLQKKNSERWLSLKDYFKDDGRHHTVLEKGEMLTSIVIPSETQKARTTFIKIQHRIGLDFAIGSIGASVKSNGKEINLSLVINSINSAPLILNKAAQIIMESGFSKAAIDKAAEVARGETGAVTNLFTSAGYKRHIVEVLVKQALSELKLMQGKGGTKH
ncbi:MAG: FAD binding domain-containing protein [Proteobacteria bacterium]|nr:FAD binding domain-containing protein [Pseudomonadota bacterium]